MCVSSMQNVKEEKVWGQQQLVEQAWEVCATMDEQRVGGTNNWGSFCG